VAAALTTPHRRQLWYAPLLALAMALMMLRLLVMARLLDVLEFGEFSGGILISSTFCMLGCLGLQPMLQREWPVNLVRGQERRALVLATQCLLVALACCVVGLIATLPGAIVIGMTPELVAVGLLHGLAHQVFLVASVESRSREDVLRFARQNMTRAVAALALSIALAIWTGSAVAVLLFDAMVTLAMALRFFAQALARTRLGTIDVLCLATRCLHRIRWRSAMTLMVVMVVSFFVLNADRWIASNRLSTYGFAQYAFVWVVLSIAQSAQAVINASVYPLIARRFAVHGRSAAFALCRRAAIGALLAGTLIAVPLGYLLGLGVSRWYPEYAQASSLLPLFLAIGVLRMSDYWSGFLLITGRESQLLRLNLGATVLGLLTWALLTRPWTDGQSTPLQVGWLAATLTLFAYGAEVTLSWRSRRP